MSPKALIDVIYSHKIVFSGRANNIPMHVRDCLVYPTGHLHSQPASLLTHTAGSEQFKQPLKHSVSTVQKKGKDGYKQQFLRDGESCVFNI